MDKVKQNANYLTLEERHRIEEGVLQGKSINQIAYLMNRSKFVIGKDIRFNGGRADYCAERAHQAAQDRLKSRSAKLTKVFTPDQQQYIKDKKQLGWSNNKISLDMSVSCQSVARFCRNRNIHGKIRVKVELKNRVDALELQMEILMEKIREIHEQYTKNK